jgi:ABC-2 type transport system ATP-binding protein
VVRIDELAAADDVLRSHGMATGIVDGVLRVEAPASEGARITRLLAAQGLYLSELRPEAADLEDVFLQLTRDALE